MSTKKSFLLMLSVALINVLLSVAAVGQNMGTCSAPYSTLTPYADFAEADFYYKNDDSCSWVSTPPNNPVTGSTVYTYFQINSGPDGSVGFTVSSMSKDGVGSTCIDNTNRLVKIFPVGSGCNWASGINPSVANANSVPYGNPEFYGLTANTNYIVVVQTTVSSGCLLSSQFISSYYIVPTPVTCGDYDMQMYSDGVFGTAINKTTFACTDAKVFLGPSSQPTGTDFGAGMPYSNVNIEFTAITGDRTGVVINRYTSANVLAEVLTNTSSGIIQTCFLRSTGQYYTIEKTFPDAGTYSYVIKDNISGAILASGTWTITLGSLESAKTILVIPSGTGTYSGPGVTNGYDPTGADDYTDDRGLGAFDPVAAGPGNHTITYTWDNGLTGTNHCSQTKTMNVTVSPCPSVPCQDYDIQMYSDDTRNTAISKTTFGCNDSKVYFGPSSTPSSADQNSGLPFNSVNITITAVTGNLNSLVVNRYTASNALAEVLTVPANGKINNYYIRPTGQYYTLDKTTTASGTYTYVITDNISGVILASGTWTITAGAESAKTILVIPSGTGGYSGPGVTNGIDPAGVDDYTDDLGLGTFDPVVAGPGNHVITYTWDNGLTGTNHCTINKTMNVTVSPCACGTVGFFYNSTSPPSPSSCSDNTEYSLRADLITTANEYIAPGITIEDDNGNLFYSSVEVEEGAGTGFQDAMGQKVLTYCVPTYQYRIRLSGSGTGTVKLIDHATGATIYSGAFSDGSIITLAPGTIKGSSVFSGPGVSNVKKGKAATYVGSGYGVFNPSLAGVGTHTITYTWDNGKGCTGTDTKTVVVSGPPTPVALPDFAVCAGSPLTLTATGGTIYSWFLGTTSIGSGSTCSPSPTASATPGVYTYYVSNTLVAGGCSSYKDSVLVTVSSSSTPTFPAYGPYCLNATPASLPTTSTNGVVGTWSPSSISTTAQGTVAYTFTPTNPCDIPVTVNVVTSLKPVLSFVSDSAKCFGEPSGSATLTVTTGTPAYTYLWSNTFTTQNLANVMAGSYSVVVRDANGCSESGTVLIGQPLPLALTLEGTEVLCENQNTGYVNSSVSGGSAPYTYLWSGGETVSNLTDLISGVYTLTVTDSKGCLNSALHEIRTSLGPDVSAVARPIRSDNALFEVFFSDRSTGAVNWLWYFGDGSVSAIQNPHHTYSIDGTYPVTLVAMDQYGCIDSANISVIIYPEFNIWIPNAFTPEGDAYNNTFGPKAVGYNPEKYSMLIFDRWGKLLFESKNINDRWDGSCDGKYVPDDLVFVYQINIADVRGQFHRYVGKVVKVGTDQKKAN